MKKLLKNQAGAVILVVILVVVLAVAGGGAAFLAVRMVVSGDGNFLQPFEDLGWIDSEDEDEDEDKSKDKEDKDEDEDEDKDEDKDEDEDEDEDEDDKKDTKKDTKKSSGNKSNYLVDDSRLSSDAKKSSVDHYYGDIAIAEEMGDSDDEFADLYKLMKAGINLYAQDGKVIEIELGFDISEFCQEAYKQYKDEFAQMGMTSADDLQEMMMAMVETTFTSFDEEYSDYITKYVDGGTFQLYVTEKGFESLYEAYDIDADDDDVDVIIDALEDSFNTKISLVKD